MNHNRNYSLTRFSDKYESKVVKLLSEEWNYDIGKFRWKFFNNPHTKKPICYIVLKNDEVVGFRGYIPFEFNIGNKNLLALSLTDGFISKHHRRKKLFTLLNNFAIDDLRSKKKFKFIYSLSSVNNSTQTYLKSGWSSSGKKRIRFFRNVDFYSFGKLNAPISIRNFFSRHVNSSKGNNFLLSKVPKYKAMANLSSKKNDQTLKNSKSADYFKWRLKNPSADYYYSYYFNLQNQLISYIILDKKKREWRVLDYDFLEFENGLNHFNHLGNRQIKSLISINDYCASSSKSRELELLGFKYSSFFQTFFSNYFISRHCHLPFVFIPLSDNFKMDKIGWDINLLDDDGS